MERLIPWLVEKAYASDLITLPSGSLSTNPGEGVIAIVNRIIDLLLAVAYPLAFAAIIYSAYLLITSAGNPEAYVKTKKNVMYLITGMFLIVFAIIGVKFITSIVKL